MLILLVEDEPLVEVLAEEILREAGHKVILANTGQDALSIFQDARPRPDVLLLDNRLPDMLGWDLAEVCRNIAPNVPIVMCSGDLWTGARDMTTVVRLEKPYTEPGLLAAIAKAIEVA